MIELQPVTSETRLCEGVRFRPLRRCRRLRLVDGMPRGPAASSFTSVSLSPPLVSP